MLPLELARAIRSRATGSVCVTVLNNPNEKNHYSAMRHLTILNDISQERKGLSLQSFHPSIALRPIGIEI